MRGRLRKRSRRHLRLIENYTMPPAYRCLHCRSHVHRPGCIIALAEAKGGRTTP